MTNFEESTWPPLAVVALGDPTHRDEGVPLRVMGRVRTLIGEIGCSRSMELREAIEGGADTGQVLPSEQGSLALDISARPEQLVQWIEGGTETTRLEPFLERRRRVILIDSVEMGGKPGSVYHWHVEAAKSGLTLLRHYGRHPNMKLDHLAFWLEDDLPASGIDLIAIEPSDTSEGDGISPSIRSRLSTISSQITALMFRILVEEGW